MTRFAAKLTFERHFLPVFLAAAWLAVGLGFYPSVTHRWQGEADYPAPLVLQLHVFAATGWLVLLTIQVVLARRRRLSLHRTLGAAALLLIPAIAITAIGAEVASQRFYSPRYPENLRFFIAALFQVLVFFVAASLALVMRRHAATHKRLIVVATSMLLVAAYNRWWGEALYIALGDGFMGMLIHNFAGPDLLILAAAGFDWVTLRRVHPVYRIAMPLLIVGELVVSAIYHSANWPAIARILVGL
ncbi:MAG: hypothetical protein WBL74_00140 [Novosphingobium sp.]|uniref:hypothetical protein n=1 Tax=Novosphingobium sp. TaxID=1874826 RepID=UPI003C7AFA0E